MVVGISYKDGQHIVTVKYDIQEYALGISKTPFNSEPLKTDHLYTYQGTARFSVEKWTMDLLQLSIISKYKWRNNL